MNWRSKLEKPTKFLDFIIIWAFISVFFYDFATFIYIFKTQELKGFPMLFIILIVVLSVVVSVVYFIVKHYKLKSGLFKPFFRSISPGIPDSKIFEPNIPNFLYFISLINLFLYSLFIDSESQMLVIFTSLFALFGLIFIISHLVRHNKDFNHNAQTISIKKLIINICLIVFCWIPIYLFTILQYLGINFGIILIILGLGYFFYQKRPNLRLRRKFLGFLLIIVVVLSILPAINDRILVRNNIQYKEIYNIDKTVPNSYISTAESFNYTNNNYNWSTNGSRAIYPSSDRFLYQNRIYSLQHAPFIPYSDLQDKFQYSFSANSIKTPCDIAYHLDGKYGINLKLNSSEFYYSTSFSSEAMSNFSQCFVFLNHSYFMNPTNVSQKTEINNGYIIKTGMQDSEIGVYFYLNWAQNQFVFFDEKGNVILVVIYSSYFDDTTASMLKIYYS